MAALHSALKTLGPLDFEETNLDDLKPFLTEAFSNAQLIVDSVPIPAPSDVPSPDSGRSRSASSASEISLSSARPASPPADVEALQKEWKQVKLNAKDNPLGMSVYKASGKDGKGAWFARRSVHEGLGFTKWKKGLEREFPETMKVQGSPGEGNIRGIGGERRVVYKNVEGVGKLEVYLLSAQFPGPTTPRDFVTMFLTSDQALSDTTGNDQEIPRHFMVISRPCNHTDTPARDGYIRGQYESVEFIREIPRKKSPQKSASAVDLSQSKSRDRSGSQLSREAVMRNGSKHPQPRRSSSQDNLSRSDSESSQETRSRGKTISFDKSRGSDAKGEDMDIPRDGDESERNPVEWIMITRSDPGGSVPRFMIERGTPGGIVADASKFLDWACAKDIEELIVDDKDQSTGTHGQELSNDGKLHNEYTNGHLAGIEEATTSTTEKSPLLPTGSSHPGAAQDPQANGGLYGMMVGAAGVAGGFIASYTPAMVSEQFPSFQTEETGGKTSTNGTSSTSRHDSVSSVSSVSSSGSFASALDGQDGESGDTDAISTSTSDSGAPTKIMAQQDKELSKLEEKRRKLEERLSKAREKELAKKTDDKAKEEEAIKKVEGKHDREVKKQEEKYKKEVEKLELKKQKENKKAEDRKRKAVEKDDKLRMQRELKEERAEVALLRKEKEILRGQVGDLQAENMALAARIGRLGAQGEEVLHDVRLEVGRSGRMRASSLRSTTGKPASNRAQSMESDRGKENIPIPTASEGVMKKV